MAARLPRALLLACCVAGARGVYSGESAKYLIASSPSTGQISYIRVRRGGNLDTMGLVSESFMQVLIGSGLVRPSGLAVDQARRKLLVADPGAQKIVSYPLGSHQGQLVVGSQTTVVQGVEAQWVATDSTGAVYFSDGARNEIAMVPADSGLRGDALRRRLYNSNNTDQVATPGGLAADAFAVYWANSGATGQVGAVVRGLERPLPTTENITVLPRSPTTALGVCIALDNVYFTQPDRTMYGLKKAGGSAVAVSDRLLRPRGCTWDGVGTVYVADQGSNAVFSFAGGMQDTTAGVFHPGEQLQDLRPAELSKTVELEDPFDVAVFSKAPRLAPWLLALAVAAGPLLGLGSPAGRG